MKAYPDELRQKAIAMYRPGVFGYRRVSIELGIPRGTITRWCNEASAERARTLNRRRKENYHGSCIECGRRTSYSGNGSLPSRRCKSCHAIWTGTHLANSNRKWTREIVIDRIREWTALYGKPPSSLEWNPYEMRRRGNATHETDRVGEHWPGFSTVYRIFGSWGEAVSAAASPEER